MGKKTRTTLLLLTVSIIHLQGVTPIVEPGPIFSSFLSSQHIQALQTVTNTANQVTYGIKQFQELTRMAQTQIEALKKLSDGDWESFIEFTYLQSQAFAQQRKVLSNVRENLDKLKVDKEKLPDFAAMDDGLEYFQGFFNRTGNLLNAVDNLQKNIEVSSAKMVSLNEVKKNEGSVISQLQIQNQELGLLRGIVSDFATMTYTAQVNLEVEKKIAESTALISADNAEKYFTIKRHVGDYIGDESEQRRNKKIREAQLF